MHLLCVFHGTKVEGEPLKDKPDEIVANPPLSIEGMERIRKLAASIRELGPFTAFYTSRMARALDTASILALELDMDFQTLKGLGQHASKEGNRIVHYPGHGHEDLVYWQREALIAVGSIQVALGHNNEAKVLLVSHRPVIGGLAAAAKELTDADGIRLMMANLEDLDRRHGYIWLTVKPGLIELGRV